MSARVAKLMHIDDSIYFNCNNDAKKEANRRCEKLKREAEQKGYAVQMLIGISDKDGDTQEPKRPHLHIMVYACPGDAVTAMLVSCINKHERKHGREGKATRHECYNEYKYVHYIVEQSRYIRSCEYDPDKVLKDFNIIEKAKRIRPELFRKRPGKTSGNDCQAEQPDTIPQPPCNNRYPHEGVCDRRAAEGGAQGIPGKKNKHKRKMKEQVNLIPRDEWYSLSAREQANYYNCMNLRIDYFVCRMGITKRSMICCRSKYFPLYILQFNRVERSILPKAMF